MELQPPRLLEEDYGEPARQHTNHSAQTPMSGKSFNRAEIRQMLHPGLETREDKVERVVRLPNLPKPTCNHHYYNSLYRDAHDDLAKERTHNEYAHNMDKYNKRALSNHKRDYILAKKGQRDMILAGGACDSNGLFPGAIPNYVGATPHPYKGSLHDFRVEEKRKHLAGAWKVGNYADTKVGWQELPKYI